MSIKKNITIDGMEVPFKASAAVPRLYRLKFRRGLCIAENGCGRGR